MSARSGGAGTPLHVAQLVVNLGMGGAEQLAVQIANARARARDVSHLICMTGPGPLSERILPEVPVRYLHYYRASIRHPWRFLTSLAQGYRLLARQLRQDGIQVVQSHLPGANLWALVMTLRGLCRAVPTVHNNREFVFPDGMSWTGRHGRRLGYRLMLRRCPAVVAVSAAVRDSLVQELTLGEREQRRLHVITNGVEVPERLAAEERAHVRSLHNIGEQELLVLAAGRLAEQKNFKTLIEAAGLLQAAGHAFRLVIGGEGPEREELAGRIDQLGLADRVQLPGNIPDLRRLMLAADIFVLSSLWEGLPLVLLEAMACGLPIVGTRISGIADVITDGIQGLLATPGDAVDLSRALGILLDDAGSRMELGREGRELVKREYDFQRVAEQLGQLYAQIL